MDGSYREKKFLINRRQNFPEFRTGRTDGNIGEVICSLGKWWASLAPELSFDSEIVQVTFSCVTGWSLQHTRAIVWCSRTALD